MITERCKIPNGEEHNIVIEFEPYRVYNSEDLMGHLIGKPTKNKNVYGIGLTVSDADSGKSYGKITIQAIDVIGDLNCAYVDTSWKPLLQLLVSKGYAYDTGERKSGDTGYGSPLYCFEKHFLRQCGGEQYRKYLEAYESYTKKSKDNRKESEK